uniref:KIB1-4 beta-propeller domain-containing protein n=1 Tax=Triticum aestivum TaxID=4565 RepID=A0A3B6S8M6_WHEAT
MLQYFYRKVVLSASPRPGCYAAMLVLHRDFGAPAFASAEDPVWRLAPSPDAVDDAIHHDGRFYSVTCSGVVQAWERDPRGADGKMTGTAIAPRLALADQDKADAAGQWEETDDIGEAALFVGLNNSLCVSTREHAGLKAGRVYFTDDELEHAAWRTDERNRYLYRRRGFQKRCIGVYDLKSGRLKKVRSPVERPSFWPPAAWFTPSTTVST